MKIILNYYLQKCILYLRIDVLFFFCLKIYVYKNFKINIQYIYIFIFQYTPNVERSKMDVREYFYNLLTNSSVFVSQHA